MHPWVLKQYCIQSAIYSLTNNTIRYSLNNEKAKPISTFVKYLYDALRYYFTTYYKSLTNVTKVYRGARVSKVEQMSFKEGEYVWNLGFLSTSLEKGVAEQFLDKL
jgi:hypothetical protein